jgi:hypothetical protein
MVNDSSTGGPLLPDPAITPPLEGQALNDFLQGWMVGICGLDGTLFRPSWQPEPANIPTEGTCWAAFGVRKRPNDTYVFVKHLGDADGGLGADQQQRHETLDILVSFYDLGVSGLADYYVSLLKDGFQVAQNLELLQLNGYGLVEASEPIAVPVLFKERWQYRVDLALVMRRQTRRQYPVRNLLGFRATLKTSDGTTTNIQKVVPAR